MPRNNHLATQDSRQKNPLTKKLLLGRLVKKKKKSYAKLQHFSISRHRLVTLHQANKGPLCKHQGNEGVCTPLCPQMEAVDGQPVSQCPQSSHLRVPRV